MRTITSVLSAAFLLLWMLIPPGIGADSNAPQFSFGKACEIGIDAHGRIYVTDSVKHIIDTRGRIYVADAGKGECGLLIDQLMILMQWRPIR